MITIPPEWTHSGYELRPAGVDDGAFQRVLFGHCRPDAIFLAQWPQAQREGFLDSQFTAQDLHYRRHFASAEVLIVTRHAVPAGRLIVDKEARGWRIIDIGLMPDHRGHGLGAALLRAVQAACADAGVETLSLHVEAANPARRLYARLGFAEVCDNDTHIEMSWQAAGQLKTAS